MPIGWEDVVRVMAVNAAIVHQAESEAAARLRAELDATRAERDRLRAEVDRLQGTVDRMNEANGVPREDPPFNPDHEPETLDARNERRFLHILNMLEGIARGNGGKG